MKRFNDIEQAFQWMRRSRNHVQGDCTFLVHRGQRMFKKTYVYIYDPNAKRASIEEAYA